ncbi:hypothetical protein VTI74DRAFT_5069 [Chaetomium olivicolor]
MMLPCVERRCIGSFIMGLMQMNLVIYSLFMHHPNEACKGNLTETSRYTTQTEGIVEGNSISSTLPRPLPAASSDLRMQQPALVHSPLQLPTSHKSFLPVCGVRQSFSLPDLVGSRMAKKGAKPVARNGPGRGACR